MLKTSGNYRWIVGAAAILWLAAYVATFVELKPRLTTNRLSGYGVRWQNGAWTVVETTPGLQPATVLRKGDQVIGVNGVERLSDHVMPGLILHENPGEINELLIRRDGQVKKVRVRAVAEPEPNWWNASVDCMLLSVAFLAAGLFTALQRPDLPAARLWAVSAWLISIRFLEVALQDSIQNGWLKGSLGAWLGVVHPWYIVSTYYLLREFPGGRLQSRFHRIADRFVPLAGGVVWILNVISLVPLLGPREGRVQVARFLEPLPRLQVSEEPVWTGVIALVSVAVAILNYGSLRTADEKRRWEWIAGSVSIALLAQAIAAIQNLIPGFFGHRDTAGPANLVSIVVPISLAYAVVRYRVMGMGVAFGLGVQYLVTRYFLMGLLLAPLTVIAYRVATQPEAPAAQVLLGQGTGFVLSSATLLLLTRDSILRWVDRRFFREAHDAEQLVELISGEILSRHSFRRLVEAVISQLNQALHPSSLDVCYREHKGGDFVSPSGLRVLADSEASRWLDAQRSAITTETLPGVELQGNLVVTMPGPHGQTAGFLLLGEKKSQEPWSARERAILRLLATQMGMRHQVLTLEDDRLTVVNEERKRISRELHDTLSQGFAGIFLHLESAQILIDQDGERTREHVQAASELARTSLKAARNSVRDLRSIGPGVDLERELTELARRLDVHAGTKIECRAVAEVPVPGEVAWHLLKVAEEAVANALKHSGASRIAIRLNAAGNIARLTVDDNGKGFDVQGPRTGGYGLIGMEERMRQTGGTLEVLSAPGTGVEIQATVPLKGEYE